jgi:DNA mismatch repair protein MLH3
VIELLQKLIYEFLKTHHYKPSAIGSISGKKNAKPSTTIPELFIRTDKKTRSRSSSPVTLPSGGDLSSKTRARMMDLENWTRVKAARHDITEVDGRCTISGPKILAPANPPISTRLSAADSNTTSIQSEEPSETVNWINPTSGKGYQVNTRTGNTAAILQAPIAGTKRSHSATLPDRRISVLTKRPKSALSSPPEPGEFVQQLLANWKNPVFALAEPAIAAIPLDLNATHNCHSLEATPFTAATSLRVGKLTKSGLQAAVVIAQLDNKYILTKMHGTTDAPMLVVIDQHAASERVRVEDLFQELCETRGDEPPDPTQSVKKALTFSVSTRDAALLKRFQMEFERWGIGYTLSTPPETVTVHTLPRIAKDRCDTEPVLAIELLRKHCYELEERGVRKAVEGGSWVEKLSQIPRPLVEMVNSRACRGAVMFNDPLTLEECQILVQRLAQCKWPFMCAHGRISTRPLVELGTDSGRKEGGGFKEAFGKWKDGGFKGLKQV